MFTLVVGERASRVAMSLRALAKAPDCRSRTRQHRLRAPRTRRRRRRRNVISSLLLQPEPLRCDDVLRVRVDLHNDLSLRDDGDGYWVRKLISSGNYKCNQVELTLYFDSNSSV